MDSTYIYNNGNIRAFEVGDRVNLVNKAYFPEGRQSRIIGFEWPLDIPYDHPVYTVGETAAYSRIGEIESKIDSLTYKGQTYSGSVAGGGGTNVYVIGVNDKIAPSDRNVFSAKNSLLKFLRKDQPDTAQKVITFLEGLTSDGFVEANSGLIVRSSKKTTSLSNALIEDSNKDSISYDLIEEEENTENLSTSLLEVTAPSGTIGSLDNVDPQADTALIGSLLAKGSESWAPIAPVQSGLTDYEHMLIPVFHTIRKQWIFIPADRFGEVVPPVSSGFPYVLPLTLL